MPQHIAVSPEEEAVSPVATLKVIEAPPPIAAVVSGPPPVGAAALSLVIPGAGQLWLGQSAKGVALLVIAVFTLSLCGLLNVIAAFDAFQIAGRRARGEKISDWQMF